MWRKASFNGMESTRTVKSPYRSACARLVTGHDRAAPAVPHWEGSVWQCTVLGAGVAAARPYRQVDQRAVVRAPIPDAIVNPSVSISHGQSITASNKERNMQHIWTVPVCKAMSKDNERHSCTHISGFVEKHFRSPALMDSARFLLINAQTLYGRVA